MRPAAEKTASLALQSLVVGQVVLWVLDAPGRLGVALYTEQFLAATLGASMALAFLHSPLSGALGARLRPLDYLAAIASVGCCWFLAWRYPVLVNELVYLPWQGVLLGAVLVALILEATRRVAGLTLVIVILVLCAYALLGFLLKGEFATRPVSLSRLVVYLGMDTNAVLGTPLQVATIVVVPFILMGQILTRVGGSDFFTDLSLALVGRYRGGAAKIAVIGSALFGMISGSAVANVAGVGTITIPMMKRAGYRPELAASIEAVGSTGGQLMPPVMGAAAFLMAEYLQIPYSAVMIAAVIPAFLYYAALFIQVDLEARRASIAALPADQVPPLVATLRQGWHFPVPFAVLVLGLTQWNMPAEYAALLAAGILLVTGAVFGYRGKRLKPRAAVRAIVSTGLATLDVVVITAAAGLVIGALNITGLSFSLTMQLLAISGNDLAVLLVVTGAVATVLGMGMPTVGVYVILATLAAPALVKAGITPLQAHMFVMYFGMLSMITPPVALAAFAAANIAGTDLWKTGWQAVRVGWCAFVLPFLFALSPSLLMQGSVLDIVLSLLTALAGVFLGSAAMVGYLWRPVGSVMRVVFAVTGLGLLVPVDMLDWAVPLNIACAAAAAAALWMEWRGYIAITKEPAER